MSAGLVLLILVVIALCRRRRVYVPPPVQVNITVDERSVHVNSERVLLKRLANELENQ
jgi:hypothetical protein